MVTIHGLAWVWSGCIRWIRLKYSYGSGLLAPGSPAVPDAFDGLAPLLITVGRLGAALNKLAIGRGACSIKTAISDLLK